MEEEGSKKFYPSGRRLKSNPYHTRCRQVEAHWLPNLSSLPARRIGAEFSPEADLPYGPDGLEIKRVYSY